MGVGWVMRHEEGAVASGSGPGIFGHGIRSAEAVAERKALNELLRDCRVGLAEL